MDKIDKPDLLIYISTAQQITNWIPVEQFQPQKVVSLQSDFARRRGWDWGFAELLGEHFLAVSFEEQTNTDEYVKEFRARLSEQFGSEGLAQMNVIWAWSGGQKPHSAALRDVALSYVLLARQQGKSHTLVYADGSGSRLLLSGQEPLPMDLPLKKEDVLTIHRKGIIREATPGVLASEEELRSFLEHRESRIEAFVAPGYVPLFQAIADSGIYPLREIQGVFSLGIAHEHREQLLDELRAMTERERETRLGGVGSSLISQIEARGAWHML